MGNRFVKLALSAEILSRTALWCAGIGLVMMTVMIAAQVFWRYILNDSIVWTEPASIMVMGWFIFLGAAVGIREGYHLSFDILLYVIPQRGKFFLKTVSDITVGGFGLGMVWYGWLLAAKTAGNKLPSLGISGAWDFAQLVVGGVLIFVFSMERVIRRAAGLSTAQFGEEPLEV